MALQQIPNVAALTLLDAWQTLLAGASLRLFNTGYIPSPGESLADVEAAETAFSGYPSGGYVLDAWDNPVYVSPSGAILVAPQVAVAFTAPGSGSGTQATVGGWFVTDAAGNLIADGLFDNPIPLTVAGDGFPITVGLVVGATPQVQCWVFGSEQ